MPVFQNQIPGFFPISLLTFLKLPTRSGNLKLNGICPDSSNHRFEKRDTEDKTFIFQRRLGDD